MRVVSSARSLPHAQYGWVAHELEELMRLYASQSCKRKVSWATAVTELDDPQFFLIGPEPEADCVVAISRLNGRYVLEDGEGHSLCESRILTEVVKQAQLRLATRSKPSLMVRIMLPFAAVRAFFDEKVEPLVPDSVEVLLRLPAFV
jgi:hypothetical protein